MEHDFKNSMIDEQIIKGLGAQGITVPTPIQTLALVPFIEGKDLIVESHTGSGKTLAFVLPLFQKIDPLKREVQAIILAPTHELVMQIHEQITLLSKNSGLSISSCPIMGEVNIENQIKKLKEKPQIVVGSVGRVLDLIVKKKITAHTIKTLVLDEADNLLDQNQSNTVKKLIYALPQKCQTCLFSASISKQTLEIAKQLLPSHEILRTATTTTLNPNIEHFYVMGEKREKFDLLRKCLVAAHTLRALIFVSQNTDTTTLVEKLEHHGHAVATISGKLTKEERKTALARFRSGKVNLLISSDLAARGLDIPDITHVFHFDLPFTAHDYLHRAGRSARGTKNGTSICLVTPRELGAIRIFEKEFNITLAPIKLLKGQMKNTSSGEMLAAATSNKDNASAKAPKNRNKYPKGYSSGKKASTLAEKVTPSSENTKMSSEKTKVSSEKTNKKMIEHKVSFEQTGSLQDAMALIAQDGFGKNYK